MRRRVFLRRSLQAGSTLSFAPYVFSRCAGLQPSKQITLGMIGTGGHGVGWNMKAFLEMEDVKILAVCDVDTERRENARHMVNKKYGNQDCASYSDFREVLARDDIDAVMISTPDHWHVPISILAAQAGKHICCEKPTLTIHEGMVLCEVMQRTDRVFQTSIEDRCIPIYHKMAELVRNGYIGELQKILIKLPDQSVMNLHDSSTEPQPVPEGFDYDMWLGPAPVATYAPGRCHFNFRWIFDYSGGMLTDWGAHYVDTAQWANNTEHTGPVEVAGKGVFLSGGLYNTADDFNIDYRYGNGVTMNLKSGGNAIAFEGSEGWIQCMGWRGELTASNPKILETKTRWYETHLETAESEHRNFVDCVKQGKSTMIPAVVGHRTSSILHMGNISMMLERPLGWNPENETFLNDPEANTLRSRKGRAPWRMEDILMA